MGVACWARPSAGLCEPSTRVARTNNTFYPSYSSPPSPPPPLPVPLITIIILSACEGLLSADVCFIAGETPSWQLLFLSLKVTAVLPLFAGYSCIIMMLLVFFGKWRSLGCLTFEKIEFNYVLRKCFRNIIFGRRRVIVRPRNQNKFQKRGWGIKIEKLSSGKCCGTRSMGFMGTSVGACGCAQPHYTQCQRIGGIFQIRFWMDFLGIYGTLWTRVSKEKEHYIMS